jgi:hypothetical protein
MLRSAPATLAAGFEGQVLLTPHLGSLLPAGAQG